MTQDEIIEMVKLVGWEMVIARECLNDFYRQYFDDESEAQLRQQAEDKNT